MVPFKLFFTNSPLLTITALHITTARVPPHKSNNLCLAIKIAKGKEEAISRNNASATEVTHWHFHIVSGAPQESIEIQSSIPFVLERLATTATETSEHAACSKRSMTQETNAFSIATQNRRPFQ